MTRDEIEALARWHERQADWLATGDDTTRHRRTAQALRDMLALMTLVEEGRYSPRV